MAREKSIKHVAVIIETSRAYGRALLRGVSRFHHEHAEWSIYFTQHDLAPKSPGWLRGWRGDGILARLGNERMAREVLATGLPFIDLRGGARSLSIPGFGPDNATVSQLAFKHLYDLGLRNFAFVGEPHGDYFYDDERRQNFLSLAAQSGLPYSDFIYRGAARGPLHWGAEQLRFARWLQELPKPVGIMAVRDDRGMQVLEACRAVKLAVPDEVAVIGVDNDEYLCGLALPSLSSVDLNAERIGYEAACLLAGLMRNEETFTQTKVFSPAGIIPRQSTDMLKVNDTEVAAALRYIREHACRGISISDVEAQIPLSRSILNRRFKKQVGRSPKAEILQVRISHAKRLLIDTDFTLARIATLTGFSQTKYFISVFHRHAGVTPRVFRSRQGRR